MPETFSWEEAAQGETFSFEDALKEGPSEVVRAAVPGSLAPDQLLPAVRLIGGETVTGAQGDTHPDIIDKWGLPARDIDQRGFTGPFGFFYDRESAAQALRAPTVFEPGRLHSTDLSTLQEPGGAARQLKEAGEKEGIAPAPQLPADVTLRDVLAQPQVELTLPESIQTPEQWGAAQAQRARAAGLPLMTPLEEVAAMEAPEPLVTLPRVPEFLKQAYSMPVRAVFGDKVADLEVAIADELYNAAKGVPEFLTTEEGMLSVLASLNPAGRLGVEAYFTQDMIRSLIEEAKTLEENWDDLSTIEKAKGLTRAAATLGFTALLGKATFGSGLKLIRGRPPAQPPVIPPERPIGMPPEPTAPVPPRPVPGMPPEPTAPVPPKPVPGMPPEPTIPVPPKPVVEAARDWETELKKKEPGAPPPPNPEPPTVTQFDPAQVPTKEVPVERIVVNKDVPNFKEDADPNTGVVPGERLEAGKYQRVGVAPIVVWQKANGEMEIITGRHRLDLARRLGEKTIPAQIVEESKGFTKEMALTFDAESNIRDGQGSIQDYAHYFKNRTSLTEAEARQSGLLSRAKGRAGWDLGKNASDDLYAGWRAKKISDAKALAIARAAPGDAAKQQLGIKLAQEGKDADFIKARLERERAKTETPVQTDMFGNPVFDDAKSDAEAARVVEIRKDLEARIRAGKNAARDPKAAAEMGIDVKDPAATLKQIEALQAELARWEGAWWLQPDLVEKVSGKAPAAPKPAPAPPPAPAPAPTATPAPPVEAPKPAPPAEAPKAPLFDEAAQKRVDALKKRLKDRLEGRGGGAAATPLPGFDPELFNIGSDLAVEYIKAGVRKFTDFAQHMIRDLGDKAKQYLISWYENAKLQLKEIAHELDTEAEAQRIYRQHFAPEGTAGPEVSGPVGGGGVAGGRPGLRISRKELIPVPREYVNANSYAKGGNLGVGQRPFILDPEQVRGINLAVDRLVKFPQRAAFVLADGTGFGKTAQLLAIADQYRKLGLGKKVLIVTKNKTIASIRFGGDADAMGIPQNSYTITTYTSLGKVPRIGWDLVLFDEAHNLKNASAKKSIAAQMLDAKHTVFATATPMDRPTGAAYFLAEITGKHQNEIARDLGYTIVEREDPITHEIYEVPQLLPKFNWAKVWSNIMAHRDAAISAGAMIRREYPFFGDVSVTKMRMTSEQRAEHNQIKSHIESLIYKVKSPTAKRNYAGQLTLQLSRWSEQAKLQHAVDEAIKHVEAGGQAIIVAETDKEQSFWQPVKGFIRQETRTSPTTGFSREVWITDGAITQMRKMLEQRGYRDIADIHDPKSHDIKLQVREFQAGRKRIALATPQSGGTGIDLDDQVGNRPRRMIALSKNLAGDDFEQLVGRVSRRDTKSPAQVTFLDLEGAHGDQRRDVILATKIRTLKAIQGGEELDVARGFAPGGPQLPGIQTAQRLDQPMPAGRVVQAMSATMFATTKTPADNAVWRVLKRDYGLEPGGAIRVSFKPGQDWRARIRWLGNEPLYIEVNSGRFQKDRLATDLQHELSHWFDVSHPDRVTVDIMRHVKPDELEGIIRDVIELDYEPKEYEVEWRAESIRRLAAQWRERPWFQRIVADVVSWAGKKLGYDMSRFDAELVAVRGIASAMRAVKDIKIRNESVLDQARKSPELVAPEWAPAARARLLESVNRLQFGEARIMEKEPGRFELEEFLRVTPDKLREYMTGRGYGEEMRLRMAQAVRPEEVPHIEAEARRIGEDYNKAHEALAATQEAFKAEHPDWELLRDRQDPAWVELQDSIEQQFKTVSGLFTKGQLLRELLLDAPKQAESRFGDIVVPGVETFWDRLREGALDLPAGIRNAWRSFSMQSLPRITDSNRLAGEAGVRYAASPMVARAKGMQFAADVTEGITMPDFDKKFGTALTEDNLRDLKRIFEEKSDEAYNRDEYIEQHRETIAELADDARDGDPEAVAAIKRARAEIRRLSKLTDEDGARFQADADAVTTTIGAANSPFRTEADYQGFMQTPEAQGALRRHIALWETEKDPIYRQASDLDPDLPLATRGVQFGARINLKDILRDQGTPTTVGPAVRSPLIRAAATLKRTDPFSRAAKGAGSYEGSYTEIMANGFGREYPVAKQHEFIRELVRGGDAVIETKEFVPDLEVKGESTKGYALRYRPWAGKWLHIRRSMAPEYEDAIGLSAARKFGIYTKAGELATRMSVQGLAEGSTHVSNLLTQVFTGLGPTGNPMLNALVKSAGRADVLYALPKILINAFANRKADMLKLAEIGAAKEPYRGGVGWFITKIDHGVRLYSAEVYKRMAEQGWVPDTETGLREYVNQVGQYNKRLQPRWIQDLRSTHIQPFATAMQTFNVQGLRTLAMSPGFKASSNVAATALRAEKAANILGFVAVVTALNMMVSGTPSGPPGTKLGAVGWIGDDKKVHQLDIGLLTGISRGARITGLQPFVEARRLGLPPGTATLAGAQGAGNTLISAGTGPINRAIWMGITGKRPSIPPVQEAQVMPPQEQDFSRDVAR